MSTTALSIPEILSLILTWIDRDRDWQSNHNIDWDSDSDLSLSGWDLRIKAENEYYATGGVLTRCGMVNSLWFHSSMRILWTHPKTYLYNTTLPKIMNAITPASRRQFYADFIHSAYLTTVDEADFKEGSDALAGLSFPRLSEMELYCPGRVDGWRIPVMECAGLKTMEIDPRAEFGPSGPEYMVFEDDWERIFEQIGALFPGLEHVRFIDKARVYPRALDRFRKRLPRLQTFDHSRVVEEFVEEFVVEN